jgi:hypothetical protein
MRYVLYIKVPVIIFHTPHRLVRLNEVNRNLLFCHCEHECFQALVKLTTMCSVIDRRFAVSADDVFFVLYANY